MDKQNKEPLAVDDINGEETPTNVNEVTIHWSEENETILVEWCDIAQCYKWLSSRAHTKFSYMHAWFTIPTITFSTISGTASFAQASLPLEYQVYAPMAIGTINILIGILTTIQQYLKISELNEAHRVSSISWDKFARNIRIELAKTPEERIDAGSFIKMCRQEFDRLMETSPPIPDYIVNEFIKKFKGQTNEEQEMYKRLKKPDICDTTINTVNQTRHKWYLEEKKRKEEEAARREKELTSTPTSITRDSVKNEFGNVLLRRLQDIRKKKGEGSSSNLDISIVDEEDKTKKEEENKKKKEEEFQKRIQHELKKQEEDEKRKKEEEEMRKKQKEKQEHISRIETYIEKYEDSNGRRPLKDEIEENFKGEINNETLNEFLSNYDNISFNL